MRQKMVFILFTHLVGQRGISEKKNKNKPTNKIKDKRNKNKVIIVL